MRYAEAVTIAVTGWLEEENETANRLRTYLDATRPAPDQPTPPLALKIWIDPDGRVSRIDFTAFANEQASMDLRATITGRTLPSAPPKDMLLPIRPAVQLPHAAVMNGAQAAEGMEGTSTVERQMRA